MKTELVTVYVDRQGNKHFDASSCAASDALASLDEYDRRLLGPMMPHTGAFKRFVEAYHRELKTTE